LDWIFRIFFPFQCKIYLIDSQTFPDLSKVFLKKKLFKFSRNKKRKFPTKPCMQKQLGKFHFFLSLIFTCKTGEFIKQSTLLYICSIFHEIEKQQRNSKNLSRKMKPSFPSNFLMFFLHSFFYWRAQTNEWRKNYRKKLKENFFLSQINRTKNISNNYDYHSYYFTVFYYVMKPHVNEMVRIKKIVCFIGGWGSKPQNLN
jgi:hypothetical protein